MKEHPIIFSGPLIPAILDGRKSVTRRVIKRQPPEGAGEVFAWFEPDLPNDMKAQEGLYYRDGAGLKFLCTCPYGVAGDRLWVRETHVLEDGANCYMPEVPTDGRPYREEDIHGDFGRRIIPHYRAAEPEPHIVPLDQVDEGDDRTRWRPSIHMPRWAARIILEVTDVRVERVQEITLAQAIAEGFPSIEAFRVYWDKLNAKRGFGWDMNPWVWVVGFRLLEVGA